MVPRYTILTRNQPRLEIWSKAVACSTCSLYSHKLPLRKYWGLSNDWAGSWLATQGPLYRDNQDRKKFIITDLVISPTQWSHNTAISTLLSRVWQIEKFKKFCRTRPEIVKEFKTEQDFDFASGDDYQAILPCNSIETKTYLIVTLGTGVLADVSGGDFNTGECQDMTLITLLAQTIQ